MLDAEYFLTHGGQRGPQTTILTPGNYRLNTYLWDLSVSITPSMSPKVLSASSNPTSSTRCISAI